MREGEQKRLNALRQGAELEGKQTSPRKVQERGGKGWTTFGNRMEEVQNREQTLETPVTATSQEASVQTGDEPAADSEGG